MVKKLFRYLHKEIGGLHQAAYLLGAFAFTSQLLALVRDRLLAGAFGASTTLDVYYAAFRIPDFIFVVVGSVVSLSILVPFLAERIDANFTDARWFIDQMFTFFFGVVVVSASVAFIGLPWLLSFLFPGITGDAYTTLVTTSRILLLSPILLGISNIFGSITQIHKRFFIYAMSPLLYNAGIICGVLFLAPLWGIPGLAIGVVGGALMHVMIQMPFAVHAGLFPRLRLTLDTALVWRVLLLSFPRTITLGSTHVMLLLLLGLASVMEQGSITIFNLAYNLQNAPLSIIGVSYSLAAFPTLSHLFAGKHTKEFVRYIITAARHIIFWTVPASLLLIVLRAHVVRVVLGSGQFDWDDTLLTAAALAIFCMSIVFQGLTLLLVRGYYSAGMTRTPLMYSVGAMSLAAVCAFGFSAWYEHSPFMRYFVESLFRVEGIAGARVLMLVAAFTVGSIANALGLLWAFQRDFGNVYTHLGRTTFEALSAGMCAGAVAWGCLRILPPVISLDTFWGVLGHGFIAGVCGIVAGVAVLTLLDNREWREIRRALRRHLWKDTTIVGPDAEVV